MSNTPAHQLSDEALEMLRDYGTTPELRDAAKWVLINRERLAASERALDEELEELTP